MQLSHDSVPPFIHTVAPIVAPIVDNMPLSTIDVLPPELFIQIFTYCVSNDALAPLNLRAVSTTWKDTVDNSPAVWQLISLDSDARSPLCSRHQAEFWVNRSQPLPVDVEISAHDLDLFLPLISPLLPSIDRWRTFSLTGRREEYVNMEDLDLPPDSLKRLHVFLHDHDFDDLDEEVMSPPKITFTRTYPMWPEPFTMNIWLSKLPCPLLLAPLRFTHVTISEGPAVGIQTHPQPVLEFLTACPELEFFCFYGWPHDDQPPPEHLPVVHLPNLRTLRLKSTCSARALLSSLNTPRLRNLYLAHLNVDFMLQQAEHREAGDSDDDARDYSQSPWSDHATGMGLRKLINQCNPPIRILEMDFSDMRTKDFRYVFDRLKDLEEFRIVASDMSDKVIALFKPVFSVDGTTLIRLPRLRHLELYNCPRLTGDAVVNSLEPRVVYTDARNTDGKFMEVAVVGCEGFTLWHEHLLSESLGKRLRTHD